MKTQAEVEPIPGTQSTEAPPARSYPSHPPTSCNSQSTLSEPHLTSHLSRLTTPFPADLLPSPLQSILQEITDTTSTPIEFTTTAALGVLSATVGQGTHLIDGPRRIRPNLYTMLLNPSDPACADAFSLLTDPLSWRQVQVDTECQYTECPQMRLQRESLVFERTQVKSNNCLNDTDKQHELGIIDFQLHELREREQRAPVLFLTGLNRQRLVQRLSKQPNEALAIITTDAKDTTPLFNIRQNQGRTALTESILLAGHTGTPLSLDITANQHLYLYNPCISILTSIPHQAATQIFTPFALQNSPLLPRFITLRSHPSPLSPIIPDSGETSFESIPSIQSTPPISRENAPTHESSHFSPLTSHKTAIPLPPDLPEPNPKTLDEWKSLLRTMLKFRRREAGTRMTASYEAKVILRAYENECRETAATTMSDIPDYPHQWAGNAWRIALLLHTTEVALTPDAWLPNDPPPNLPEFNIIDSEGTPRPKPEFPPHHTCFPEISPETATAAVALMRWYAEHQLKLLTPARERLHLERDPILARTLITLERSGGRLPLGKLAHNHNITNYEAQCLATTYPHLLRLHQDPIPKKGRPTTYLAMVSPPASHLSPIIPNCAPASSVGPTLRDLQSSVPHPSPIMPDPLPQSSKNPYTKPHLSTFELRHSVSPSQLSPIIPSPLENPPNHNPSHVSHLTSHEPQGQ